ncbi:MAG: hypothetical protein OFPII_21280 [Osedax symbiont Rs1]|nr:MAG: hypothetical protein OFPII_21280 [Osedax symbiont Rs1]
MAPSKLAHIKTLSLRLIDSEREKLRLAIKASATELAFILSNVDLNPGMATVTRIAIIAIAIINSIKLNP